MRSNNPSKLDNYRDYPLVLSYPLEVAKCQKIFVRDLHADPFLQKVLRNHVLIKGIEHFAGKAVG